VTDAAAERAALAEQLDGWVDVTARRLAGGDSEDLVFAQLALGLSMAADEQLADLAATAIMRSVALAAEIEQLRAQLAECRGPVADGPADADSVWVSCARRGIEMHALTEPTDQAARCGRSTRTGQVTTGANARERWYSTPCPRCWPVTS
jgi:hypothetical protein